MAEHDALLKHLTIRNRVMSTAHAPGYPENGMPTERYQLYHAEKAEGGIGLTIFGGSSSVAVDSLTTAFGQVAVYDDKVISYFHEFADRVHGHGAALMCQITHMGRRNNWDTADWLTLIAPSLVREHSHRAIPKEMEDWDFKRVIKLFGQAARRCKDGGLDGIELLFGAQHLIEHGALVRPMEAGGHQDGDGFPGDAGPGEGLDDGGQDGRVGDGSRDVADDDDGVALSARDLRERPGADRAAEAGAHRFAHVLQGHGGGLAEHGLHVPVREFHRQAVLVVGERDLHRPDPFSRILGIIGRSRPLRQVGEASLKSALRVLPRGRSGFTIPVRLRAA